MPSMFAKSKPPVFDFRAQLDQLIVAANRSGMHDRTIADQLAERADALRMVIAMSRANLGTPTTYDGFGKPNAPAPRSW